MQLRLPRPKDQEKRRKRPPIVSTADNPVCAICNRQISRYHCPACNLPYCSLACYKSPEHGDCSEKFDRQSLVDEIKSAEGKTSEEKRAMMDMLRRFEEENGESDDSQDGDENERDLEREELEKRLGDVDLDSLPPDELLALLSPAQQAAFTSTLSDPARIDALVAQELETEQPWWIGDDEGAFEEAGGDSAPASPQPPPLVEIDQLPPLPFGVDGRPKPSSALFYNMLAVLLAYSYTLRTFALSSFASLPATSSERMPATQLVAQLVPFLVERSNTALNSLEDAIEYVASRQPSILANPLLVALLLRDLSELIAPTPVTEASDPTREGSDLAAHSLTSILRALSDLHGLFRSVAAPSPATAPKTAKPSLISRPSGVPVISKAQRSQAVMAAHKLAFYVSLVAHPKSPIEPRFVANVSLRASNQANSREREATLREEAVRQKKQDESSKFLVDDKRGRVRFEVERQGQDPETSVSTDSRIVEIE